MPVGRQAIRMLRNSAANRTCRFTYNFTVTSQSVKSEAERRLFFGSVDANRLQLSIGRDIALSPKQDVQRSITSSTRMSR